MATELFNVGDQGSFSTKDAQGPPIYVGNATVLGYTQDIEYFGSDIGFKKTISLDLSCITTDISNQEGISLKAKDLLEFLDTSQDYSEVVVNGRQMGAGKVTGFSVEGGDMVNEASCSVSFLIYQTYADLTLLSTSTYYKDYANATEETITTIGQILDSFTDSVSLSRGNNSTNYSRSISISANKSLNISKLGDLIRIFVKEILGYGTFSFPDLSNLEGDINKLADPANGFKKFITETTDETANNYSFQETLQASNVQDTYSSVITHSYSRTQNGVETVTENGALIGLTSPRIDAAEAAYLVELDKASGRMIAFHGAVGHNDSCPALNTLSGGGLLFLRHGKVTNTFEGTISYSLEANNDPTYKDGQGEKWEYTVTLDSDGVYQTATEQGSINGRGHIKYASGGGTGLGSYTKYQTAKTFLLGSVFPGLNGRITPLIDASNFSVSPKPTRRAESHAPRQGVITYTRTFSNNPIYELNDATNRIKKLDTSSTLQRTVPITHSFVSLAPDDEKQIVQRQSTESLSTVNSSINAMAYRIDVGSEKEELSRLGERVKSMVAFVTDDMDGDTVYMNSASFTFTSLNDVSFSLSTSYNKGIGSC